jgi:hypothetical protein
MVKSPLYCTLSAAILTGMLQNLLPVMLVNRLAWMNLVINKALQLKCQRAHHIQLCLTSLFSHVEKTGFSTERTCVCFLGDSNHGFCLLL